MELVLIDPATGEEEELVATGALEDLEDHAEWMRVQADEDGYDVPWIIIQPAA